MDCKITFLVNYDQDTTIQLHDPVSSITFAEVHLTNDQLAMALSRLGYTPCKIELRGLDKVGKKMIVDKLEFEMPLYTFSTRKEIAYAEADRVCPEGWEADLYFGSQNSFFKKDGKEYARTTIRKWIDV